MGAGAAKNIQSEKAQHAAAVLSVVQAFEENSEDIFNDEVCDIGNFKRRILLATEDSRRNGTDVSNSLAQLTDDDIETLGQYYNSKSHSNALHSGGSPGIRIEEFLDGDDESPKMNETDDEVSISNSDEEDRIVFNGKQSSRPQSRTDTLEIQNLDTCANEIGSVDDLDTTKHSDDGKDSPALAKIYPATYEKKSRISFTHESSFNDVTNSNANTTTNTTLSSRDGKSVRSINGQMSDKSTELKMENDKYDEDDEEDNMDFGDDSFDFNPVRGATATIADSYKKSVSKLFTKKSRMWSEVSLASASAVSAFGSSASNDPKDFVSMIDQKNEALMGLQRTKVWSSARNAQLERDVEILQQHLQQLEALDDIPITKAIPPPVNQLRRTPPRKAGADSRARGVGGMSPSLATSTPSPRQPVEQSATSRTDLSVSPIPSRQNLEDFDTSSDDDKGEDTHVSLSHGAKKRVDLPLPQRAARVSDSNSGRNYYNSDSLNDVSVESVPSARGSPFGRPGASSSVTTTSKPSLPIPSHRRFGKDAHISPRPNYNYLSAGSLDSFVEDISDIAPLGKNPSSERRGAQALQGAQGTSQAAPRREGRRRRVRGGVVSDSSPEDVSRGHSQVAAGAAKAKASNDGKVAVGFGRRHRRSDGRSNLKSNDSAGALAINSIQESDVENRNHGQEQGARPNVLAALKGGLHAASSTQPSQSRHGIQNLHGSTHNTPEKTPITGVGNNTEVVDGSPSVDRSLLRNLNRRRRHTVDGPIDEYAEVKASEGSSPVGGAGEGANAEAGGAAAVGTEGAKAGAKTGGGRARVVGVGGSRDASLAPLEAKSSANTSRAEERGQGQSEAKSRPHDSLEPGARREGLGVGVAEPKGTIAHRRGLRKGKHQGKDVDLRIIVESDDDVNAKERDFQSDHLLHMGDASEAGPGSMEGKKDPIHSEAHAKAQGEVLLSERGVGAAIVPIEVTGGTGAAGTGMSEAGAGAGAAASDLTTSGSASGGGDGGLEGQDGDAKAAAPGPTSKRHLQRLKPAIRRSQQAQAAAAAPIPTSSSISTSDAHEEKSLWTRELDSRWAEVGLLLRKPIENESDVLYTFAAAEAGLIFADELNETAKSLNVLRGTLSRWLLPYDNNTRIDEQCSTPHSVVENMPDALRGKLTERQVHYLVAGVNSVRKLVRIKIADDNDLAQARRALKITVEFFKQLQDASAAANISMFELLNMAEAF